MKEICIIGSGAAGILLLLNLEANNVVPEKVTIVDPYHDGGELARSWSHVRSNTTWRQILEAAPPKKELPSPWKELDPEQPCDLWYVIRYLQWLVKSYYNKCNIHTGQVNKIIQREDKRWELMIQGSSHSLVTDIVCFTTGSEPKSLDCPFRSIPLSIALDENRLKHFVSSEDNVLLFGTAHSATLIVKNLVNLGAKVTNFYLPPKPFFFAKDGDYDGLKQDAAVIAEKILNKEYPNVQLVSVHDTAAVIRASKQATAAIYAIGFQSRNLLGFTDYDELTGRLKNVTNAWGFGIAYPNQATDGHHWDVSVPAFQAHIQKQLPDILSSLGIEA
jgi:hypothetical protein